MMFLDLAGLFVAAMILHQALRSAIHRLILGDEAGSDEARTFYASARRLLDYVGSIIVLMLALDLTGLHVPIARALSIRVATPGNQPLTPLVLIEAVAIVAGFIFVAQLYCAIISATRFIPP
jgi:thiosulfate reductase cytochrome b subunit